MTAFFVGHLADGLVMLLLAAKLVMGVRAPQTALLYWRHRAAGLAAEQRLLARPLPDETSLPAVLVQVPTYNEGDLVWRILGAVTAFDWPRDRLHIQLLDDSSGESAQIARDAAAHFRDRGHDVAALQRADRAGFKAGALKAGLACSTQPFIAIFDADYVPRPDFLRLCLRPLLADSSLAFVQARCDFLNPDENRLTRAQCSALGAHFGVEQPARSWSRDFLPFNGTCGVWRRVAIDEAGGWQGDTLTEDIDLSYRAYLLGWRALCLATVAVPGELPNTLASWSTQQRRWNKGYAQTTRKILPGLLASRLAPSDKFDAVLLLGGCVLGPLTLLETTLAVLDFLCGTITWRIIVPLALLGLLQGAVGIWALTALTPPSPRTRPAESRAAWLAMTCSTALLAMAMQLHSVLLATRDVIDGLFGRDSPFMRTPKQARPAGVPVFEHQDAPSTGHPAPQRLHSASD